MTQHEALNADALEFIKERCAPVGIIYFNKYMLSMWNFPHKTPFTQFRLLVTTRKYIYNVLLLL